MFQKCSRVEVAALEAGSRRKTGPRGSRWAIGPLDPPGLGVSQPAFMRSSGTEGQGDRVPTWLRYVWAVSSAFHGFSTGDLSNGAWHKPMFLNDSRWPNGQVLPAGQCPLRGPPLRRAEARGPGCSRVLGGGGAGRERFCTRMSSGRNWTGHERGGWAADRLGRFQVSLRRRWRQWTLELADLTPALPPPGSVASPLRASARSPVRGGHGQRGVDRPDLWGGQPGWRREVRTQRLLCPR